MNGCVMKRLWRFCVCVVWLGWFTWSARGGEDVAVWHLPQWQCRQTLELIMVDPAGRINTGTIKLEAPVGDFAERFRDVRVVDENGRPVKCHLADEEGEMLKGEIPPGVKPALHFEVTGSTGRRLFVYYGNPTVSAAWQAWEKQVGQLTLETRENSKKKTAANFNQMRSMIAENKKVYGTGRRRQINDPANPFGPNDYYLSTYQGLLYAPVEGVYAFGTDSDDASFLWIGGTLIVQWPGAHTDEGGFSHFGRKKLEAGIHTIQYFHVQAGGGALASAGWRPPGAAEFVLIPENAFVRELRTRTLLVERKDSPLSVFFDAEALDVFRFGADGAYVARVAFNDLSRSGVAEIALRTWDFGGGVRSSEERPELTLIGGSERAVTLRCVDGLGFSGAWTRRLEFDGQQVRRVGIDMEISAGQPLLIKEETVRVKVTCHNDGRDELQMTLAAVMMLPDGTVIDRWQKPLKMGADSWQATEFHIAKVKGVSFETGSVDFQLEYMKHPVMRRRLIIRKATERGVALALKGGKLVDAEGNRIIFRLSDEPVAKRAEAFAAKLARGERARILFVDDALGGFKEDSYISRFIAQLRAEFPVAGVDFQRVGNASGHSYTSFQGLIDVVEAARTNKPELVIVAGSLRDIMRFDSIAQFERKLFALVDCIESECQAEIVLIASPPVIANPGFGKSYAIAVKRVGLKKQIRVVDGYTAFMTAVSGKGQSGWQRFYRDPDSAALIYHLAPMAEGQALLADTLWRTLFPRTPVPKLSFKEK